jgi:hypothetical protein
MEEDVEKLKSLLRKSLLSLGDVEAIAQSYPQRVIAHYENASDRIAVSTSRVTDGFKPFETAVSHPRYYRGKWMIVEAYDTQESAELGHYRWLAKMTGDDLPEVIPDAVNCVAAQCCVEAEGKLEYRLDENGEATP